LKKVNLYQEKNKGLLGIEGTLPADIASCTTLESLGFYGNNLNGTLPNFSNLTNLKLLDLHFNKFTGALPTLSAKNISYISLANNFLTGTIPASYAKLSALTTLGLAYNKLTGTLTVVNSLQKLKVVYMRNNTFTGPLPSIPPTAAVVDLDNNAFTSFPEDICKTNRSANPRAYSQAGGCKQDCPTQGFNTCCMSGIPFDCDKPPPCLANCDVVCKPKPTPGPAPTPRMPTPSPPPPPALYKCVNSKCVQQGAGIPKATCEQLCG
jgi:hypothetical protein